MRILILLFTLGITFPLPAQPQNTPFQGDIPLMDITHFKAAAANWQVAGEVTADLKKNEVLKTSPGTGILVNLPDEKNKSNIFSVLEHGDMDLDVEFMMAKHSNSGIYLQGRYEVQLLDSWGVKVPRYGDVGGIYQRSVEGKGVEGYAPRVNVARAPGLWQQMHIEFQAPRFNAAGNKVENARIIRLELNGVTLHENLELTGPTAGQGLPGEAAKGPFMIQGDHGPVAFRNFRYTLYEPETLNLANLKYEVYTNIPNGKLDLSGKKPAYSGTMDKLTQQVVSENEKFVLKITGIMPVPKPGKYNFQLMAQYMGQLTVGGKTILPYGWHNRSVSTDLTAGDVPIEIIYHKEDSWYASGLGLFVSGPGVRMQPLHTVGSMPISHPVNPIYITPADKPEITRCFIDYMGMGETTSRRIVHAISVGFPGGISYTYDADKGSLIQAWKGGYLEATPMWNDRGDGSSRPEGSVLPLGEIPNMAVLLQEKNPWPSAFSEVLPYKFEGYGIAEADGSPVFTYTLGNTPVSDRISLAEEGKYLIRSVSVGTGIGNGLNFRMAEGKKIENLGDGLFAIDKVFYIRVEDKQLNPVVRNSEGKQELIVAIPSSGKETTINYAIIW
ncbi:MAG: family 16 glycoside hydrolase [Bacteroidia bacterium]|nr:family 16 glycoside hydrolase [Bacteroidia bacterium]